MKKFVISAFAIANILALPILANTASAQSAYNNCVRECSGGRQCIRACGEEHQPQAKPIKLPPPTNIPIEDDTPVAKWIDDALNPPGGGGGGGGAAATAANAPRAR